MTAPFAVGMPTLVTVCSPSNTQTLQKSFEFNLIFQSSLLASMMGLLQLLILEKDLHSLPCLVKSDPFYFGKKQSICNIT